MEKSILPPVRISLPRDHPEWGKPTWDTKAYAIRVAQQLKMSVWLAMGGGFATPDSDPVHVGIAHPDGRTEVIPVDHLPECDRREAFQKFNQPSGNQFNGNVL